jgi:hypothetical protein
MRRVGGRFRWRRLGAWLPSVGAVADLAGELLKIGRFRLKTASMCRVHRMPRADLKRRNAHREVQQERRTLHHHINGTIQASCV